MTSLQGDNHWHAIVTHHPSSIWFRGPKGKRHS
jgi:hypothetical protein